MIKALTKAVTPKGLGIKSLIMKIYGRAQNQEQNQGLSFFKDAKGAAAVEFALIVGPLIFMIFACIELALVIMVNVTLENATSSAARQIRMGIITAANSNATQFKQKICDNMGWLASSCLTDINIDVKTFDNFALVPTSDPITSGKIVATDLSYDIGAGSKIQLVRVYYTWTLLTPFLSQGLSKLSNGQAVISTKIVFRNEPF